MKLKSAVVILMVDCVLFATAVVGVVLVFRVQRQLQLRTQCLCLMNPEEKRYDTSDILTVA